MSFSEMALMRTEDSTTACTTEDRNQFKPHRNYNKKNNRVICISTLLRHGLKPIFVLPKIARQYGVMIKSQSRIMG